MVLGRRVRPASNITGKANIGRDGRQAVAIRVVRMQTGAGTWECLITGGTEFGEIIGRCSTERCFIGDETELADIGHGLGYVLWLYVCIPARYADRGEWMLDIGGVTSYDEGGGRTRRMPYNGESISVSVTEPDGVVPARIAVSLGHGPGGRRRTTVMTGSACFTRSPGPRLETEWGIRTN